MKLFTTWNRSTPTQQLHLAPVQILDPFNNDTNEYNTEEKLIKALTDESESSILINQFHIREKIYILSHSDDRFLKLSIRININWI